MIDMRETLIINAAIAFAVASASIAHLVNVLYAANVPFADKEVSMVKNVNNWVSLLTDFMVNCGMARAFAFLMKGAKRYKTNSDKKFSKKTDFLASSLIYTIKE